jgi:hypothetical protein
MAEIEKRRAADNRDVHQDSKPPPPRCSLAEVHAVFGEWFGPDYDFDVLDVTLAAAASEQ